MSQKWEFNGVELEVDLEDADFAERYEKAFENMELEEKKLVKTGSNSEMIRGYCRMFFKLFDDIYGPNTSERLFEGKMHSGKCDEAYGAFINAARRCNQEALSRRTAALAKYAPRQNREQRRHNAHYNGQHYKKGGER